MKRISKIIPERNSSDFKQKALRWAQQYNEVVFLESNAGGQISQQQYKSFDAILALGAYTSIS